MQVLASRFLLGVLILMITVLQGCARERGVDVIETRSVVYVAMNPTPPMFEAYVLALDPETYEVLDSLHQPEWTSEFYSIHALQTTPRIVVGTARDDRYRILDVGSNAVIASLEQIYSPILSLPDRGVLLGAKLGGVDVYEDTTYVLRKTIPYEMYGCKRLGQSAKIVGLWIRTLGGVVYPNIMIYDLDAQQLVDSFQIDPIGDGSALSFVFFDVSPEGRYSHMVGADRTGQWVVGYDLCSHSVIFKLPKRGIGGSGNVKVSPDGRELWVTWGANPIFVQWPEWVHIFDARSGATIDSVDVRSEIIGWPRLVSPAEIEFSRDDSRAFIACGTGFTGPQPLLVVDAESHQLVNVLFPNADRIPRYLAIGSSELE